MSIINTVSADDSYQKTSVLPSSSEASSSDRTQQSTYNSTTVNATVRDDSSNTTSADKHTSASSAATAVASQIQGTISQQTTTTVQEEASTIAATAEEAEEEAKELIQELNTQNLGLSFTMDEELERTVISVMDRNTDEVVREIPSEEFQRFSKAIKNFQDQNSTTDGVLSSSSKNALRGLILEDKA